MKSSSRSRRLASLCAFAFGAALLAGGASAQSGGPEDWSGFYLGAEAGWAFSAFDDDWRFTNPNYFNTLGATTLGSKFGFSPDGFIGGGLGGYNLQSGNWVFGAEIGIDGTFYEDKKPSRYFPTLDTFKTEVDWIATVAGRLGYASGRWFAYAKGGYAGGDVELRLTSPTAGVAAKLDSWANGYVAGAGLEYALSDRVVLGVGYSHVGLFINDQGMSCPACGVGVGLGTPDVDADVNIDKVGARLTVRLR